MWQRIERVGTRSLKIIRILGVGWVGSLLYGLGQCGLVSGGQESGQLAEEVR